MQDTIPVELSVTEIKTLLEALSELPYTAAGERTATDKLRTALKNVPVPVKAA